MAHDDLRSILTARARQVMAGASYNHYRREQPEGQEGIFFEMALPLDAPRRSLEEQALPQMARYLSAKDIDVQRPRGVTVAVFLGESCYLIDAQELMRVFCEIAGLNQDALHFRILRWLNP